MQNNQNLQEVLVARINAIDGLTTGARLDYFKDDGDDLVVNAIGGSVDKEYMDGTREVSLTFEVAVKSKSNRWANDTIWAINGELSAFDIDLSSTDNSYTFLSLNADKPAINGRDEQGYFIYTMQVTAKIELPGEE